MKKKVMVLGGTYWQIPLIEKLHKRGCYVICVSPQEDSPAFSYSDECVIGDILDRNRLVEIAKEKEIDAVMSEQCDIATPSIAYVAKRLGQTNISEEMAELYTNKYRMREFLEKEGFYYPEFKKCYNLSEAIEFFRCLGTKMVIKPLDSNSSRGVYTVHTEEELEQIWEESISFSKVEKAVICERFLTGTEFTIDGIVTKTGHHSLAISKKEHFSFNENIASSLFFSYKDDDYDYEELRRINDCLVNKTGLQLGLTHAEYINEKGKWYLVEIGCRGGGNLISSHIVPMQSGVDNYEILISQLLNEEYDDVDENTLWKNKYSVLKFLDTEVNEGVVEDIIGVDELSKSSAVKVYKINYSIGDTVNLSDDSKRLGFYVADTDQKDELTNLIKRIKSNVKLQIV